MATVHIDELSGTDSAGRGALESPYQSLGYAIFDSPDAAKYLVRKDSGGEYAEPTQSSLKKAKKTAEGLEKKKKKAEELKEREAAKDNEEKEKREKLLEESKKVVLVEDESLPPPKRVRCHYMLSRIHRVQPLRRPRFPSWPSTGPSASGCLAGFIV